MIYKQKNLVNKIVKYLLTVTTENMDNLFKKTIKYSVFVQIKV